MLKVKHPTHAYVKREYNLRKKNHHESIHNKFYEKKEIFMVIKWFCAFTTMSDVTPDQTGVKLCEFRKCWIGDLPPHRRLHLVSCFDFKLLDHIHVDTASKTGAFGSARWQHRSTTQHSATRRYFIIKFYTKPETTKNEKLPAINSLLPGQSKRFSVYK